MIELPPYYPIHRTISSRILVIPIKILCIWVFTVFSQFLVSESFAASVENKIEELLALPEEKIDIGIASLIISKDIFPDLDVNAYSAKIDNMVSSARNLTKGSTDPDYRIRALNTYLFKVEGIQYDFADPYGKNIKNRYINGILDGKKGNCVSMPILYLAVAQRLGYPVYAVGAPDHLFLRYLDPNFREQNIEVTGGGGYVSNEKYIIDFQISEKGIKSGSYLKAMTHRELLADIITSNAVYWGRHGNIKKAIRYLERCYKISPTSAEINDCLGRAYLTYSKDLEGKEAEKYKTKGLFYKERAVELGLVRLPTEDYIKQLRKKATETIGANKGGG